MQESKKLQRASNFRVDGERRRFVGIVVDRVSIIEWIKNSVYKPTFTGGKKNEKFDDHSSSVRVTGSLGFFGKKLWGKKKPRKPFENERSTRHKIAT